MDFSSEEEVKKALKCNREYMGEDSGPGAGLVVAGVSSLGRVLHTSGSAVCRGLLQAPGTWQRADQTEVPALVP